MPRGRPHTLPTVTTPTTLPIIGVKIADFTRNDQINSRVQISFKLMSGNTESIELGTINAQDLYQYFAQNKLLHKASGMGVVKQATTTMAPTRRWGRKKANVSPITQKAATG